EKAGWPFYLGRLAAASQRAAVGGSRRWHRPFGRLKKRGLGAAAFRPGQSTGTAHRAPAGQRGLGNRKRPPVDCRYQEPPSIESPNSACHVEFVQPERSRIES